MNTITNLTLSSSLTDSKSHAIKIWIGSSDYIALTFCRINPLIDLYSKLCDRTGESVRNWDIGTESLAIYFEEEDDFIALAWDLGAIIEASYQKTGDNGDVVERRLIEKPPTP